MTASPADADPIGASIREHNARLVRRALVGLAVTAVVTIAVCTIVRGTQGFVGSLAGVAIVAAFFGADVVALRLTRGSEPATVFAVVVMLYLGKLIIVLGVLYLLKSLVEFDTRSCLAAVIVGALATGIAALRLWSTMHVTYVEP